MRAPATFDVPPPWPPHPNNQPHLPSRVPPQLTWGAIGDDEMAYGVIEPCLGGELTGKIEQGRGIEDIAEFWKLTEQLVQGVNAMHQAGIIHLDLKPPNAMLTESGDVRITDLGLAHSRTLGARASTVTGGGTDGYMAPEVKAKEKFDHKADIYSLAVILYEMSKGDGKPYIYDNSREKKLASLTNDEQRQLVDFAMHDAPNDRPTAAELLEKVLQLRPLVLCQ